MEKSKFTYLKKEILHNKKAFISLMFLILIVFNSISIGFYDCDPDAINISNMLAKPSMLHWFGTDELGRDYLIRVIYGGRVSLTVGVLAMLTSIIIGTVAGISAGYFGGHIDNFIMRLVDIFSAVPWIIMVTVVSLLIKKGIFSIILVIGMFSWMEIARLVRAETLTLKQRDYIQYADFIGTNPWKIMWSHIIPAVLPTIITAATTAVADAIMTESSMSFLGIGVQAPMASWGSLLQSAQANLDKAFYMAVIPGILIILTICSFNNLGNLIRAFAEPKSRSGESNG
jgi:peptide/nickel transport system permease protein